jgi:hypothetical protein
MNLPIPQHIKFNRLTITVAEDGAVRLSDSDMQALSSRGAISSIQLLNHPRDWFDYLVNWYYSHLRNGGDTHSQMEQIMFERRFVQRARTA